MMFYLAIDIGASSGRHIVGWKAEGKICTEEVYRFPNGVTERDGRLTWDIAALKNKAFRSFRSPRGNNLATKIHHSENEG